MANTSIVEQSDDIELTLTIPISDSSNFIAQTGLTPGKSYRISVRELVNQGVNVGIQNYTQSKFSRVNIQHTLEGVYADKYKTAPPMLTFVLAAEMPQAGLKLCNFEVSTPKQVGKLKKIESIGTRITSSALGLISPSLEALITSLPSVQNLSNLTPQPSAAYMPLIKMLDKFITVTSQKDFPNTSKLYYLDFGRNVYQQISILSVKQTSAVTPLNVIIYTIACAVIKENVPPSIASGTIPPIPGFVGPV